MHNKNSFENRTGICNNCIRPCNIDTSGEIPICVCEYKETNHGSFSLNKKEGESGH